VAGESPSRQPISKTTSVVTQFETLAFDARDDRSLRKIERQLAVDLLAALVGVTSKRRGPHREEAREAGSLSKVRRDGERCLTLGEVRRRVRED
jgi:hypothetical protein